MGYIGCMNRRLMLEGKLGNKSSPLCCVRAGKYWAQNCWRRIGKKKCLNGINIKRVSIGD